MNLREFRFLTDENIHPEVVGFLRRQGCDVLDIKESGLSGAADLTVIQRGHETNRIILTHDSDFGALAIASGKPTAGIVYLRPGHIRSVFTIETLRALFEGKLDLSPPFIVVEQRVGGAVRIRVRKV